MSFFGRSLSEMLSPGLSGSVRRELLCACARAHETLWAAAEMRLRKSAPALAEKSGVSALTARVFALSEKERRKVFSDPSIVPWMLWARFHFSKKDEREFCSAARFLPKLPLPPEKNGINFDGADDPLLFRAARAVLPGQTAEKILKKPHRGAAKIFNAAMERLRRIWPAQHASASMFVRRVVFVSAGGFEGSIPALPGTVFLRSGRSWYEEKVASKDAAEKGFSALNELEFLLHESAHQAFIRFGRVFPLWKEDAGRGSLSPWSGRFRRDAAMAAGLQAYWITREGFRRALARPERMDARSGWQDAARKRIDALDSGFARGLKGAEAAFEWTPHGRSYLESVRERVDSVASLRAS